RGAAIKKGRERGPGHPQDLGGFCNGEIKRLDDLHPDELSRMGRTCHTHHGFRFLLMAGWRSSAFQALRLFPKGRRITTAEVRAMLLMWAGGQTSQPTPSRPRL